MHSNLVLLGSNKEERGGGGGDLSPESRTWSKEEIMGRKVAETGYPTGLFV